MGEILLQQIKGEVQSCGDCGAMHTFLQLSLWLHLLSLVTIHRALRYDQALASACPSLSAAVKHALSSGSLLVLCRYCSRVLVCGTSTPAFCCLPTSVLILTGSGYDAVIEQQYCKPLLVAWH